MDKVYIVCWGCASNDDNGNNIANANVHGVYRNLDDAKAGLLECKNEFVDEIVNNPDYDEEDRELAEINHCVYGSVEDDYFEIDYASGDTFNELRIELVIKEIK
jgi:hypothetical protein